MKPFEFMYVSEFPCPCHEVDGHFLIIMDDDGNGKDNSWLKFFSDKFDGYCCCLTSGTPSHSDDFIFDESLRRDLGANALERRENKSLTDKVLYERQ